MRLQRNRRALSPIFATLILIAIAVIAGIIVYMFTSGTLAAMMGGGTAGQEKVAVQGVEVATTTSTALAQNTGTGTVTITTAIVKNAAGNVVSSNSLATAVDLVAGVVTDVDFPTPAAGSYTVTLVSDKGGSFVSSSFVVP